MTRWRKEATSARTSVRPVATKRTVTPPTNDSAKCGVPYSLLTRAAGSGTSASELSPYSAREALRIEAFAEEMVASKPPMRMTTTPPKPRFDDGRLTHPGDYVRLESAAGDQKRHDVEHPDQEDRTDHREGEVSVGVDDVLSNGRDLGEAEKGSKNQRGGRQYRGEALRGEVGGHPRRAANPEEIKATNREEHHENCQKKADDSVLERLGVFGPEDAQDGQQDSGDNADEEHDVDRADRDIGRGDDACLDDDRRRVLTEPDEIKRRGKREPERKPESDDCAGKSTESPGDKVVSAAAFGHRSREFRGRQGDQQGDHGPDSEGGGCRRSGSARSQAGEHENPCTDHRPGPDRHRA